jgi:hypothetical protein
MICRTVKNSIEEEDSRHEMVTPVARVLAERSSRLAAGFGLYRLVRQRLQQRRLGQVTDIVQLLLSLIARTSLAWEMNG